MTAKEQKFLALINENRGIIHRVCHLYAFDSDDREDLFQEILLQLWRAYSSYREEARFSTWMYRISLNTAISGIRKQKRRPITASLEGVDEKGESGNDLERSERQEILWKAIARLSRVEKAIVILYLEEHSYEEIAEVMGLTVNHIGVKINRIKKKLRGILNPHLT